MDPVVVWILRGALALLLASAALHKLRAPGDFVATLRDYRVLPSALVPLGAATVVASETGVAIALLVPESGARAALAAAVLLCVYSAAIGANLARGRRHIDCGCLGPRAHQPIHSGLLARNAALAAAALLAALPGTARALGLLDAVSVAGGVAVVCLLFQSATTLLAQAPSLRRST